MVGKIITAILLLLGSMSFAADPFSGTWLLNPSKSKIPPPMPKTQTARIVVDGSGLQITEEIVNASGERLNISVKAKFHGKDYPVTGTPQADMAAYQRIDAHTIKGVVKKAGKVVMNETVVVSPDGKTMTGTYSGIDASGRPVTAAVAVFEKK